MKQPEALRLADEIENQGYALNHDAAAELRRLHEANQAMLAVLKSARELVAEWGHCASTYEQEKFGLKSDLLILDNAIAKGEQQ